MTGDHVLLAIALLLAAGTAIALGLFVMLFKGDLKTHLERHKYLEDRMDLVWADYVERMKGKRFIDPSLLQPWRDEQDDVFQEYTDSGDDGSRMPAQVAPWKVQE
jgi:hypothetical protein